MMKKFLYLPLLAGLYYILLGLAIEFPLHAAGTVAPTTSSIVISWDSNTTVANGTIPVLLPPWVGGGKVISCSYYTGGTTPSFVATLKIGATAVTGCTPTITSATATTTAATANNTFTNASNMTLVISGVSGTPNQALIQINIQTTAN